MRSNNLFLSKRCFLMIAVALFFSLSATNRSQAQEAPLPNISKFSIDIDTGSGGTPDSSWWSITGGDNVIEPVDYTTGEDPHEKKDGVKYTPVRLHGPMTAGSARADLLKVLNEWVTGTGKRIDSSLELIGLDGDVIKTINYLDCIPIEYVPPPVREGDPGPLEERFTFKPMLVDAALGVKRGRKPVTGQADDILPVGEAAFTDYSFGFELNGIGIPVSEVIPGALRAEADNRPGGKKGTVIPKPLIGHWKVTRDIMKGDTLFKDLFDMYVQGDPSLPGMTAALYYYDASGAVQREIRAFNVAPIAYDPCSVDSRDGMRATESIVLKVDYMTYK